MKPASLAIVIGTGGGVELRIDAESLEGRPRLVTVAKSREEETRLRDWIASNDDLYDLFEYVERAALARGGLRR